MCERRLNCWRMSLWQVAQVSLIDCLACSPSTENCAIGLWQSLHESWLRWWIEPSQWSRGPPVWQPRQLSVWVLIGVPPSLVKAMIAPGWSGFRSEEHTSELQSLMRISYAVFCLKKNNKNTITPHTQA